MKSEKATILFTATIGRACPIVKKNRETEKLTDRLNAARDN